MHKNDYKIRNYSNVLAEKYGEHGTPERAKFDEEAYAFYTGQVILDARKSENMTQKELAEKLGVDKSYISKIENGVVNPSVGFFYRIMNALGLNVEITKTIG
ncbi:MAG: helix-turn-helix domain-containing protein [Petrimonas sp.]|jgi:DNA-binding XRE family transcriptional regulator